MAELLEGSKVFTVPLFQRQYSWGRPQWRALWENILEQYEYYAIERTSDQPPINHFIGSFVFTPLPTEAPPSRLLVVDGQQRLITVSILLAAIRDLRWEEAPNGHTRRWLEDDFTKTYLVNSTLDPTPETRFRVLPTQEDRVDYASTVGDTPGSPSGKVGEAYRFFRKAARTRDASGSALDLERLTNVTLGRLSLVDIRTEPGDNVHRVFQTLNSSGISLKQIDLLRNHFFMLLPNRGEDLYQEVWRDMELRLGESTMDKFFWAGLVASDPRVSRKTVFSTLQHRLSADGTDRSEEQVESLLRRLNEDSKEYLKLIEPQDEPRPAIRRRLAALERWGTDTYFPLGLRLLTASREGRIHEDDLETSFLYIESFLVRRMLVGIPTNNLNRIFAALTGAMPSSGIRGWLYRSLASPTRLWPDDALVRDAIRTHPFIFSGQPHQRVFVLERLHEEASRTSEANELTHTSNAVQFAGYPQTLPLAGEIPGATGKRAKPGESSSTSLKLANTLGNVVLINRVSGTRNPTLDDARDALIDPLSPVNDAVLSAKEWTPERVRRRSDQLADLAIRTWPGPSRALDLAPTIRPMDDIALLLPEGGYTTVLDLAELWSRSDTDVRDIVAQWPIASRQRVLADSDLDAATLAHVESMTETLTRRYTARDMARLMEEEDSQHLRQSDQ